MNLTENDKPALIWNMKQFKKFFLPLVMLCLVIAVSIFLFIYRDIVAEFEQWGYIGVFLISVVGNATILLPMPGLLLVIVIGTILNPLLVSLIAGLGSAIGELSGYIVGYCGHEIAKTNTNNKWFIRADRWMSKQGTLTVFIFAPFLPLDVAGIIAGAFRFPVWKFLAACFFGKTLLILLMVYSASWGWDILLRLIG
ncbi:YqaA family protein [Chloroflexota bacterium]